MNLLLLTGSTDEDDSSPAVPSGVATAFCTLIRQRIVEIRVKRKALYPYRDYPEAKAEWEALNGQLGRCFMELKESNGSDHAR